MYLRRRRLKILAISGEPGVSVIIPSSGPAEKLMRCLNSIAAQSVKSSAIQVVIILNGQLDNKGWVIQQWAEKHPELNCTISITSPPNSGRARNEGIKLATREYLTFVDDDDWLQRDFLSCGLECASKGGMVVLPNLEETYGTVSPRNTLNRRIRALKGRRVRLRQVPWVLGYNAGKFVPRKVLVQNLYPENLQSGEDVVFFAKLLKSEISVYFCYSNENGYVRTISAGTVSRQPESFEFSVRQRLQVIRALREIDPRLTRSLQRAQLGFVERYLVNHPEDVMRARLQAMEAGVTGLKIGTRKADRVVFTAPFPPASDPSGNVVLKRILDDGRTVDVINWDLRSIRQVDQSLEELAETAVGRRFTVPGPPSFANWRVITTTASIGALIASAWGIRQGGYQEVYSRALWSWGHVAAFVFSTLNRNAVWTAEFSDPLRVDALGEKRRGNTGPSVIASLIRMRLRKRGYGNLAAESHFALVEAVTLVEADQIVFTNEVQLDLVLQCYPEGLREVVKQKASVIPQPSPPDWAYDWAGFLPSLDTDVVNIGYFGRLYTNRDLQAVAAALESLGGRFRLHFYGTEVPSIRIHSRFIEWHYPLSYLEFLSATKAFDVLLIIDADTKGRFDRNPFLPSKLSDYVGSGVPIWGIVEPGSPLSESGKLTYESFVGDLESVVSALYGIQRDVDAKKGMTGE